MKGAFLLLRGNRALCVAKNLLLWNMFRNGTEDKSNIPNSQNHFSLYQKWSLLLEIFLSGIRWKSSFNQIISEKLDQLKYVTTIVDDQYTSCQNADGGPEPTAFIFVKAIPFSRGHCMM